MYIKGRELGELVDDYGSMQEARDSLLQLVQTASSLSFALRAPSYNDVEIGQLHKHAQDMVGWAKHVLKRAGVRPSMHTLLHFKEAILDHGKSTNENCYRV
ncbi:unnamed protein product, partial [Ectocarpus sp. 4 AP-2014]